MYPNYVGQSLRQLSGDVRNFAEAPSRNAYRQSMAELEGAKFDAQKPMIEIQAGEAKEQLRPATMQDVVSDGMPEHIKAAIFADNNIEGQPSAIDRIFATTGVTKGDDDVLYRDGKPLPYYAWRSPRYQQKVTGVLKSIIKPNKYAAFESAYLEPKIKDGTATPEEIAKYKKFSELTPEQNRAALQKHGQDLRWLYADAMRRGDKVEAENIWRDAEYNANQIEGIDKQIAADLDFEREKKLIAYKNQFDLPSDTRTSNVKDYEYAAGQGYNGTLEDWMKGPGSKKKDGQSYTIPMRVDDNETYYNKKMALMWDKEMGAVKPGMESDYDAMLNEYKADRYAIVSGGEASWEKEPEPEKPKPLDEPTGIDLLKQAGWDGIAEPTDDQRNAARKLAKEQGYTF